MSTASLPDINLDFPTGVSWTQIRRMKRWIYAVSREEGRREKPFALSPFAAIGTSRKGFGVGVNTRKNIRRIGLESRYARWLLLCDLLTRCRLINAQPIINLISKPINWILIQISSQTTQDN